MRELIHKLTGKKKPLLSVLALVVIAFAVVLAWAASRPGSDTSHGAGNGPDRGAQATTAAPGIAGNSSPTRNGDEPLARASQSPTMPANASRPLPPTPHPYPTYRSTAGYTLIAKYPSIPFPADQFNYMNEWRRTTSFVKPQPRGYELRALAGAEGPGLVGGDPGQGVIVLITTTTYMPSPYLLGGPEVYRTPAKVGPVQIVWADYSRLLVVAADDTAFLFDVSNRQWLWPPNVKQPVGPEEQAYQARMKVLLNPFVPPPPPLPTTVDSWLRPDPTDTPQTGPPISYDDIGQPSGAGRLIQDCENPRAGQPFLRRNCWYTQLIDGTNIGLGAGFGRKGYGWPAETGLIIVSGCPGDFRNGTYSRDYDSGLYVAPRKVPYAPTPAITADAQGRLSYSNYDWVQVVDAQGERVHLVAQDGTEFTFDLATCHWVVPPVPTATAPPPTFTPVTPSPTELPWYAGIPLGDERNYVLKMEQLSNSVLTAVALTPLPGTPVPTSTPLPTSTPHYAGAGIIVQGPFPPAPSEIFRYRNFWYEQQTGRRITVYAGVEGSKGSRVQGMIEVIITSPDGQQELQAPQYYKTPTQSGYVQVVSADGEKIRLRTWNGTDFLFDLTNRRWLQP